MESSIWKLKGNIRFPFADIGCRKCITKIFSPFFHLNRIEKFYSIEKRENLFSLENKNEYFYSSIYTRKKVSKADGAHLLRIAFHFSKRKENLHVAKKPFMRSTKNAAKNLKNNRKRRKKLFRGKTSLWNNGRLNVMCADKFSSIECNFFF